MKPYFKIREMPYNLRNRYALKLQSKSLCIMKLSQFYSEHVYCGIGYHSRGSGVSRCLNSSPDWKLWIILSALAPCAAHDFVIACYEQVPLWVCYLSYSMVCFWCDGLYDWGFVGGYGQCWVKILLLLLLLLLCRKLRTRRAPRLPGFILLGSFSGALLVV